MFSFLFCCFSILLMAQEDDLYMQEEDVDPCEQQIDSKLAKDFKKARSLQNQGKKEDAYPIYEKILSERPDYLEALYYYGRSHYLTIYLNNFVIKDKLPAEKAISAFNHIYETCPTYKMEYAFYGARLCYLLEKFDEAIKFATVLQDNSDLVEDFDMVLEAKLIIEKSRFWDNILNNPVPFNPKPVEGISTQHDEYLATLTPDGSRFYFTRRQPEERKGNNRGGFASESYTENREYFSYSDRMPDGKFGAGQPLPYPFNQSTNEGGPAINLNNDYLVFTKKTTITLESGKYYNYDLYYSELIDGEWTEPQSLGSHINRPNSWESQPSLSADGKLLFFASDRPGGTPNSAGSNNKVINADIWYCVRNEDGSWSKPANLGPTINTSGNERSPFLHTDSKTLYFSSTGHPSLGGLDIFYSKLDQNNKWTTPVNIGYPINSEKDELDFFVSLDGKTGYFASNNIGRSENACKIEHDGDWNIYEFELHEKARALNMAIIKGEVTVEDGDYKGTVVELRDTAANIISSTEVNQYSGQYAIATEIDENIPKDIIINVKKTGHVFDTKIINTSNMVNNVVKSDAEIKKVEAGKEYELHDIYFGTNLYNLTSHSKYVINLFIEFLVDNPTVKAEIQGHTDNVGNDADNLLLSERRAKSVYDYVISKGIDPQRVRHKGYGRTKPIASNDTPEGRAKNRRTIFLIYER